MQMGGSGFGTSHGMASSSSYAGGDVGGSHGAGANWTALEHGGQFHTPTKFRHSSGAMLAKHPDGTWKVTIHGKDHTLPKKASFGHAEKLIGKAAIAHVKAGGAVSHTNNWAAWNEAHKR